MFLLIGWIILYIKTITRNSPAVFSPPLILFSLLSAITFLLLLVLFWRHNQFAYKRRYSQWERSFLPTLWHSNGARILAPRNQQTEQAISALVLVRRLKTDWTLH